MWSVTCSFPVVAGTSPLVRLANKTLADNETRLYKEFLAMARKDVPQLRKDGVTAEYSYEAGTTLQFQSREFLSLTTSAYAYTAGAHGLGVTRTYNFALVGGKPKRVGAWDVFKSTPSDRQSLQLALLGKAMQFEHADWIQDGTVTTFTQRQLDSFWTDGRRVHWEFDPYELGAYASGPFTLSFDAQELRPMVRPESVFASLGSADGKAGVRRRK